MTRAAARPALYHEVHGAGTQLVLLHGAFGTIDSCFHDLLPRLAARRQVIAVELQGHGHTPDVDRPLTYPAMADDVAALLARVGDAPVDVVGYSMGGAVGLELALRYRQLVRRLVFAGGAAFRPDGMHPEVVAAFEGASADQTDALDGSVWHRAYLDVAPDPAGWPTLVAKVGELDRGFVGWTPEQLGAVAAPVLLIVGDADLVRPEHAVEMFHHLGGGRPGDLEPMPPSRLAVLPGTNHVGVLERVDWLESMITDFLDH